MYSSELTNTWLQTRQPEWIKKKKRLLPSAKHHFRVTGVRLLHLSTVGFIWLICYHVWGKRRHKYRQRQYCNLWYLCARFWNVSKTREMDDLAGNDVGIMGHKQDRRLGLKQKCFVLKKPFEVIISVQQIYGPSNLWSARLAWVFLPLLS